MRDKHDQRQMGLFPPKPFASDLQPGQIKICTSCGKDIFVVRRISETSFVSDYLDAGGKCWDCAFGLGRR